MAPNKVTEDEDRPLGTSARLALGFLAVVFVLSVFSKAMNMQEFQVQIAGYEISSHPGFLLFASWGTLAWEMVLSAALVGGYLLRGWLLHLMTFTLVCFTFLIAVTWPEDCGCFGAGFTMTPPMSIGKNIILMFVVGIVYWDRLRSDALINGHWLNAYPLLPIPPSTAAACALIVGMMGFAYGDWKSAQSVPVATTTVVLRQPNVSQPNEQREVANAVDVIPEEQPVYTLLNPDSTFGQFVVQTETDLYDLGSGEYLVAFLSYTCDDCKKEVPFINALNDALYGSPAILGLGMGQPTEEVEFHKETVPTFPIQSINHLKFFEITDSKFPVIMYIRDGEKLMEWHETVPTPEEIYEAMAL